MNIDTSRWAQKIIFILRTKPEIVQTILSTMRTGVSGEIAARAKKIQELGGIVPDSMLAQTGPLSDQEIRGFQFTDAWVEEHGEKLARAFENYSSWNNKGVNPNCSFRSEATGIREFLGTVKSRKALERFNRTRRDHENQIRELELRIKEHYWKIQANNEELMRANLGDWFAMEALMAMAIVIRDLNRQEKDLVRCPECRLHYFECDC
jgi:hypothetical protein